MRYIIKSENMKSYTKLHNEIIHNCKYELDTLGLATILLSKPSHWNINVYGLMNELKIGKDRALRLLSSLEKQGYIYKQKNKHFAKKGEQKVFYYMFDSKEILRKTFPESHSNSCPQLPFIESSHLNNPHMDFPVVEESTYSNKNIINNKTNNINKNTKLTLHQTLDRLVDQKTKTNILNANPNLTLEFFEDIYKRVLLEHKNKHCNNINATLVMAVAGRWKFRSKQDNQNSEEKTRRIILGNFNHYLSYFRESSCKPEEILQKFQNDCLKHKPTPEMMNEYSERLKKELGI